MGKIMRTAAVSLSWLLLAACVLLGTWLQPIWNVVPERWLALAVAAIIGLVAGAVAPRQLSAWLAWIVLVVLAWALYVWAAFHIMTAPMVPRFLAYPLSASVGVAAGLIARRMPAKLAAWRFVPIALGAAAVVGVVLLKGPLAALGNPGQWQPPAFSLQLANGDQVTSQSLVGKTVVLSFWGVQCKPCLEELPALQRFYETHYLHQANVRFFLVNEDSGPDSAEKAAAWLNREHVSISSVLDPTHELDRLLKTGGILPTHVVIGANHRVLLTTFGYSKSKEAFPALRAVIKTGG